MSAYLQFQFDNQSALCYVALHIWKEYPTLTMLMEMVMTSSFTFPPSAVYGLEDLTRQILSEERQVRLLHIP